MVKNYKPIPRKIRNKRVKKHPECEMCGCEYDLHVHHKDKNTDNNIDKNLQVLCYKCHYAIHKGCKSTLKEYKSITPDFKKMIYEESRRRKLSKKTILKEMANDYCSKHKLSSKYSFTKRLINKKKESDYFYY